MMLAAERYLKFLEFKVVRRLDGILQGDYSGLFYGPGMELGEVRNYHPGDDIRHIDWNVTARTNRVHVRQFIEERELTAWIIVDRSRSIAFGTAQQSKRDIVRQFATLASHLYARHGNRVGLVGFSQGIDFVLPPGAGRIQTLRVVHALQEWAGSSDADASHLHSRRSPTRGAGPPAQNGHKQFTATDLATALTKASRLIRRRCLVFVVSDFLVAPGWEQPFQQLARRNDVVAVRVVDPREREIPDVGLLRFEDPETGEQLWVDTGNRQTRERFRLAVLQQENRLAATLSSNAIDLLTLSTAESIVEPLLRFVSLRKRRRPWNSPGR